MVEKGKKKGTVRFTQRPPAGSEKVLLAGDFNGWEPARMKKQQDGLFALDVRLPAGSYEYRFIVDGRWQTDLDHSQWKPNPFGSFNSVAIVE